LAAAIAVASFFAHDTRCFSRACECLGLLRAGLRLRPFSFRADLHQLRRDAVYTFRAQLSARDTQKELTAGTNCVTFLLTWDSSSVHESTTQGGILDHTNEDAPPLDVWGRPHWPHRRANGVRLGRDRMSAPGSGSKRSRLDREPRATHPHRGHLPRVLPERVRAV